MKTRFLYPTYLPFLFCLILAPHHTWGQPGEKSLYVLAPNGLNFRSGPQVSDEKLLTLPYGTPLVLLTPPPKPTLSVDKIPGGMARVSHVGTQGYVFDGYLSPFPAPETGITLEDYVEELRDEGLDILYEEHLKDWGGYIVHEVACTLPTEDWKVAYLVARQIFLWPENLFVSLIPGEQEDQVENPDKHEYAWEDFAVVNRNKQGGIQSIQYTYRGEATGMQILISQGKEAQGIRISKTEIAD